MQSFPLSRRAFLRSTAAAALAPLLAACTAGRATPTPASGLSSVDVGPGGLRPVIANSELAVGKNRFAIGLLDEHSRTISDAQVRLGFFKLNGDQATKVGEEEAAFRWVDSQARGIYTAVFRFDSPGLWGVQVDAQRPGQGVDTSRISFEVKAKGSAPAVGDRAIPSRSPTVRDVKDPAEICSNVPPCPLHEISVADALAQKRPLVLLFASPGFCVTQTCAPELGVVLEAADHYRDTANFIHVEIYKDPRNRVPADTVVEWGLQSEPWIFVVDSAGTITDRFEGVTTLAEVEEALGSG